jgi:hypothetical protein
MRFHPPPRRTLAMSLTFAVAACGDDGAASASDSARAGDSGGTVGAADARVTADDLGVGGTGGGGTTGGAAALGGTPAPGGTEAAGGRAGQADAGGTPCAGDCTPTSATIEGDLTWTVRFDASARARGAVDCHYTRHYVGVQVISEPWACPTCDFIFSAQVEMTEGLDDCYAQVSSTPPLAEESIAYGRGVFYRGTGSGGFVGPFGSTARARQGFTAYNTSEDNPLPRGGAADFEVRGAFTVGEQPGEPNGVSALEAPATYACGWPKAAPPPYAGPYTANDGDVLPDGLFLDKCEEAVRLHDFAGRYLVVDMSAIDCPPCRQMAAQENDFIARLAADGLEVQVISLMSPSLADPYGHTTTRMLADWTRFYDLEAPVLADRGWGPAMFVPLFGADVGSVTLSRSSWRRI